MPAYIEVHVVGNGRAYIEASGIAAVITGAGTDVHSRGNKDMPVRILLRVGETLDVIGDSAGHILARCYEARNLAKARKEGGGDDFYVDYLMPMGDQE